MPPVIGDPDELATAIRHMAESDARKIRGEAEEKIRQIRNEAGTRADNIREPILADARARAKEIGRQQRAEMTREEKHNYLRTREGLIDAAWEAAEKRLRAMTENEDAYAEILRQLTMAAVAVIGSGEALLAADEKGHRLLTEERLASWSKEASRLSKAQIAFLRADRPADTWGGLIVMNEGGHRRVDLTFAARLRAAREEIRNEVFNRLVTS